MKPKKVTQQDLADARYALAMEILSAPNAPEILQAMSDLTVTYARHAHYTKKKAKKGKKEEAKTEARRWKLTADEFYTVLMCAVYTKQDQTSD